MRKWLMFGFIVIISVGAWIVHQKVTDETYGGMSIIPEQHEDIPLYDGLEPTRHEYVIEGNQWQEIHQFYQENLPENGWEIKDTDSALSDDQVENDWSGFYSYWRKEGLDWELWISANYNQLEKQTEVIFDKHQILEFSMWINKVPESICIYGHPNDEGCLVVKDSKKIERIVYMINNEAYDTEKLVSQENYSTIQFKNINVKVHFKPDDMIYLESDKGEKVMKPDPESLELVNLRDK